MTKNFSKFSMFSLSKFYLSFGYIGFLPKAPGTWGSFFTLPLIYGLHLLGDQTFFATSILLLVLTPLSIFIAESYQKKYHVHDPGWIVIDEVLGMLTTFLIFPLRAEALWLDLSCIFMAFRFFDIYKIWPVSYFDRKVKHGAGTILDDVAAGLYAGFTLHLAHFLFKLF